MTALTWDQVGERVFETGVDRGVLFIPTNGVYNQGHAWNGLVSVTESPSGAEAKPQYADNGKYLNLISAEDFGGTIEAFTYPDAFGQCDGSAEIAPGVFVGQQNRKNFGLAYRSLIGNDTEGTDHGYKLHFVYGALAAPSEKAHSTVNDSPEAITLSWALTTTAVEVPGHKPSATVTIDSRKVDSALMAAIEEILYGTAGVDARLPLPAELMTILSGAPLVVVVPTPPTFVQGTNTITIPATAGIVYTVDGVIVPAGALVIIEDTVVVASPAVGYKFPLVSDNDWYFDFV